MTQASPTTLQFLFDFGSPNAYLCHRVLPQLAQRCALQDGLVVHLQPRDAWTHETELRPWLESW